MNGLLLGVDLGTGGCKVSIIDQEGRLLSSGFEEYITVNPHPGWAEREPEDWYESFQKALAQSLAAGGIEAKDIIGIGIDASTHNAVLLDGEMKVLRPCIMWTDQRSTKQVDYLKRNFGEEIFQIAYQMPSTTWTMPQLMWVRENDPETMKKTRHLMFTKDYLRYRLTGTWETDYVDAQGSMLLDMDKKVWSQRLCEIASLPMSILPPLVEPTEVVGTVTRAAAMVTGLVEGTPIIAGASDTAIEDFGVGAVKPGQCVVKMATAGNVNVMTAKPHPTQYSLTYRHVVPGLWYTAMGTNSAASSKRWFRDVFCGEEVAQAEREGRNVYEIIDEKADGINPGADGLFFHPYLMGERSPYWDPNLRASFVGASSYHGKGHFVRALLEGVAFSLRDCFAVVEELGMEVYEVRFIGGGAKSVLWRSILADVLNRPILKVEHDDASFGSALAAGLGIGVFSSFQEAAEKGVRITDQIQPKPDRVSIYRKMFTIYKQIHDNLAGTYHDLHEILTLQQRS
jgi:xylulokinase